MIARIKLRICKVCQLEFQPRSNAQRTCGGPCTEVDRRRQRAIREGRARLSRPGACVQCGSGFDVPVAEIFCCDTCMLSHVLDDRYGGPIPSRASRDEWERYAEVAPPPGTLGPDAEPSDEFVVGLA